MNNSLINASVSMYGLQQKLDIMANNVANMNTTGFKKKEASFTEVLTNVSRQPNGFQKEGRLTPLGYNQGWGSRIAETRMNMAQGPIQETNNSLDLAVEGDGFIELQGNSWTRDGALSLSPNPLNPDTSLLTNKDGKPVMDINGQSIAVPNNTRIVIDSNGGILAYNDNADPPAAPQRVGQIRLVRVIHPELLQQVGDNQYQLQTGVDFNQALRAEDPVPDPNDRNAVKVRQGFLEQSNVNLSEEMTEIIAIQRAFQLNSRAISSADTLMNLTNNLRG